MRLKSIKLAGFKSFVDATTVSFPTNLSAVVGPNGCGKSNIIDAVRWVMGESSAKNLRGEAMTDVIFNGSSARKPVGQASIELIFDNSDASLGGEYAAFSEIAIKRKVNRDGKSDYFLNASKCRRRDITDIFLGTGLGPRSYAIIEQGMISRLIESKPEELRVFIEEAAGISKYKERRRETENRMRRTQDNLARLGDIREELTVQLSRLEHQAQMAQQYRQLRDQERQLKTQLVILQWQELAQTHHNLQTQITQQTKQLDACTCLQTQHEAELETLHSDQTALHLQTQQLQEQVYRVGSEIAKAEQSIALQTERAQQLQQDLAALEQQRHQLSLHIAADTDVQNQRKGELKQLRPKYQAQALQLASSKAQLCQLEEAAQKQQQVLEQHNQKQHSTQRQYDACVMQAQQIKQQLVRLQEEQAQQTQLLEQATAALNESVQGELAEAVAKQENTCVKAEQQADTLTNDVTKLRQMVQQEEQQLANVNGEIHSYKAQLASLTALQSARLTQDETTQSHLAQYHLDQCLTVFECIQISPVWEHACELVLGQQLQARLVDSIDSFESICASATPLSELENARMMVIEQAAPMPTQAHPRLVPLADYIQADDAIKALFYGVFTAKDLATALSVRAELKPFESIICPDGSWLGPHWLRLNKPNADMGNVFALKQEIEQLEHQHSSKEQQHKILQQALAQKQSQLIEAERQLQQAQLAARKALQQLADMQAQLSAAKAEYTLRQGARDNAQAKLDSLELEAAALKQQLMQAQQAQATLEQNLLELQSDQAQLLEQRGQHQQQLDAWRDREKQEQTQCNEMQARIAQIEALELATGENLARIQTQIEQLNTREQDLKTQANQRNDEKPLEAQLAHFLEQKLDLEKQLNQLRQQLSEAENTLRESEKKRAELSQSVQTERDKLEALRLKGERVSVELDTLEQRLTQASVDVESLKAKVNEPQQPKDESIKPTQLTKTLAKIEQKISDLGAINLAAIDEYQAQLERKTYLDGQAQDLESAQVTLESAIKKIDKETRGRFQATFEQVNQSLQDLFPKVFGGGKAYLALTSHDLLETGISIMAQPPGKRNSTIHLLSGGEKALTAIALVFSIFKLNSAPFCMLDEVDAPLDDANVARYARMVKEMSNELQFIYISHNKIAMEMADSLLGVTMHEPGVSRLVSVDITAALALAES